MGEVCENVWLNTIIYIISNGGNKFLLLPDNVCTHFRKLGIKAVAKIECVWWEESEISGSPIDAKLFLLIFKTWRHTGCGNMTYQFRYP